MYPINFPNGPGYLAVVNALNIVTLLVFCIYLVRFEALPVIQEERILLTRINRLK